MHLVYFVVIWLNAFLDEQEILERRSPEIVTGREIDYNAHCKHLFVLYVEAHNYHTFTSEIASQTQACIA